MLDTPGTLSLPEVAEIAHGHGLPVIVDAAAALPPRSNLRRFIAEGADLVTFSGGKAIGGPQASGVLVGRADLIASVAFQHQDMDVRMPTWAHRERAARGRGAGHSAPGLGPGDEDGPRGDRGAGDRSEVVCSRQRRCRFCPLAGDARRDRLEGGRYLRGDDSPALARPKRAVPYLWLDLDPSTLGFTAYDAVNELLTGDPAVAVAESRAEFETLIVSPMTLDEAEAEIVGDRLRAVLTGGGSVVMLLQPASGKKVLWQEMLRHELLAALENRPVVIVPVGSVEQHGPHCPQDVDISIPYHLAIRAADAISEFPVIVAPPQLLGFTHYNMGEVGTITLGLETFIAVLCDISRSIWANGFHRIILLNGHGGNEQPTWAASVKLAEEDVWAAGAHLLAHGRSANSSPGAIRTTAASAMAASGRPACRLHLRPHLVDADLRVQGRGPAPVQPGDQALRLLPGAAPGDGARGDGRPVCRFGGERRAAGRCPG